MTATCCCSGCSKCSPPCRNRIQTGVRFADYCRACHRSHLCSRCGSNAIASSSVDSFCSTCLSTRSSWCSCTGCQVHGGHHANQCSQSKQNSRQLAGYCFRCAPHRKCPSCAATLPHSPAGDLLLACHTCRPSQCLCPSCANHVPTTARCSAMGSLDSGGYCGICAPAWRCSCSDTCPKHRNQPRCSAYVSTADFRAISPAPMFPICRTCSVKAKYCGCDISTLQGSKHFAFRKHRIDRSSVVCC